MKPADFSPNAPGKIIRARTGYFAFIPNPLPPNLKWTGKLITLLSEADRSLANLRRVGASFPVPQALLKPLVRKEAVLSSRIEGTRASFKDLMSYEIGQLALFEIPSDAHEVHNYVRALDYAIKNLKRLPLSLLLIRESHAVLLEGVRGKAFSPGEFRTSQNWIGSVGATIETARFVPPPPEAMLNCMNDLEEYIHRESELPPLIRVALIHYQFEAIHPFLDGNGRIGRLLISLLLIAWDLLPQPFLSLSEYIESNRQEYYDRLLAVSQRNEWEAWLVFFLTGLQKQAQGEIGKIEKLAGLRAGYRSLVASERAHEKLEAAIDFFIANPIATIPYFQKLMGLGNYVTAQRYIEKLVKAGIVRAETGKARNRIYRAEGILRALGLKV
jgi:Fic family protein